MAAAKEDLPASFGPMTRFSRRGSNVTSNPITGPKPSTVTRSNRMAGILELGQPEPERERHRFLLLGCLCLGEAIQRAPHKRAADGGLVLELPQERLVHEEGPVVDFEIKEPLPDRSVHALGLEREIRGALQPNPHDLAVPGEGGDPVEEAALVVDLGARE